MYFMFQLIVSISCAPHPEDFKMTYIVYQTIKATKLFQYLDIIYSIM
jgi:hypothetical protein